MNRARLFLKSIAVLVTVAFLSLTLQPLALAANAPSQPKAQPRQETNEEKLSKTLEGIEKKLDTLEKKLAKKEDASKEKSELKILKQDLDTLDTQALKDFDQIEQHIKDKNLPPVILNRHLDAVKQYKQEMATLKANLTDTEQESDDAKREFKVKQARDHLKAKQKKRGPKTKFDPNDMPHKALEPNPNNKPRLKKEEFTRARLHDNPYVKVASHGGVFAFDKLAGANDPAYLASTVEVTLTDAIKAKANELEHHPVKIYNWVRNNVEWLPTWGASQDADITLGSQRGNAFDIASLLIALYRASGIPARYVHGTIDVPEDKFRNWAGGFTDIKAAGDYAASGGIPVTAVTTGGKITKIRMEHIWVEAALDFQPSRGAINRSADTWIALDPSYKQYEDLQGIDVLAVSGLDPQALAESFASSGTVNEQEGWVSGLNPAILQNAQTQAQTAIEQHIQNNIPNPTVGDVIGGRKIITKTPNVLPTALPNRLIATGARYGTVPGQLQNTMAFGFGIDILGDPNLVASFPFPKVNNHKVTLSFRPATLVDQTALLSLIPSGISDASQLPASIPSYLINVVPEIAIDGKTIVTGGAMRLGEDIAIVFDVGFAGSSNIVKTYQVPAGSYLSLGVVRGSVSPEQMRNVEGNLVETRAVLNGGDPTLIGALTQEDLLGSMFYAGMLGYFGQYVALARLSGIGAKVRHNLGAGFGSLGYEPEVDYFFGFPRAIKIGGIGVNVWVADVNGAVSGDADLRRAFQLQMGIWSSAFEHSIPEQLFSIPQQPVTAISAVKALEIAAAQGQSIFHITAQNKAQVLPQLHLDGLALEEISVALSAGREVIAHTDRIALQGWIGEGYILFDPISGAGAYKITGGANGAFAFILFVIALFLIILAPFLLVATSPFLALLVAAISAWSLDSMIKAFQNIVNSNASDELVEAQIAMLSIVSILTSLFAIRAFLSAAHFKAYMMLIFTNIMTRLIARTV